MFKDQIILAKLILNPECFLTSIKMLNTNFVNDLIVGLVRFDSSFPSLKIFALEGSLTLLPHIYSYYCFKIYRYLKNRSLKKSSEVFLPSTKLGIFSTFHVSMDKKTLTSKFFAFLGK